MFDGSKEGALLRRYETACEREFHKAIADLMKLRKGAASRPEPEPEGPRYKTKPSPKSFLGNQLRQSSRFRPGSTRS